MAPRCRLRPAPPGPAPPRTCDNLNPVTRVDLLQSERLLLPAPSSLLVHSPWREAGLIALPPVDPLWEALRLLVRQEHLGAASVEELGLGSGCLAIQTKAPT
jgi:hypothetical protein